MSADVLTRPVTVEKTQTGHQDPAHIIGPQKPEENAGATVFGAYVEGTVLVALCGKKFVPSKSTHDRPVCPECQDVYDLRHPERGGAGHIS